MFLPILSDIRSHSIFTIPSLEDLTFWQVGFCKQQKKCGPWSSQCQTKWEEGKNFFNCISCIMEILLWLFLGPFNTTVNNTFSRDMRIKLGTVNFLDSCQVRILSSWKEKKRVRKLQDMTFSQTGYKSCQTYAQSCCLLPTLTADMFSLPWAAAQEWEDSLLPAG